jgi:hypothetical protein
MPEPDRSRQKEASLVSIPSFYSDRANGAAPRTHEQLPEATANGLKALAMRRIDTHWLAKDFPEYCYDGNGIVGTDHGSLGSDLAATVPAAAWPLWQATLTAEQLFDLLEYVAHHVSKPLDGHWHSGLKHHELNFDDRNGRAEYRAEVNTLLSRGGTVYEMNTAMQIERVGSPEVQAALRTLRPDTGDAALDGLLETARTLYLSRKPADRATAIERLWDGFERLKTIDDPTDKKRSVTALLAHISDQPVRDLISEEMVALTKVGNGFQIRHHEVGKHPIPADAQDYFATRMVNLIVYLLDQSGRLAPA